MHSLPLLHGSLHVGNGPIHVLVGLDRGLLGVLRAEEALEVGHHDEVGQGEEEGPALGAVAGVVEGGPGQARGVPGLEGGQHGGAHLLLLLLPAG